MCAAANVETLSVVMPKVESPADVEAAAEVAPVQAIVESPLGLAVAVQVAAHERVVALILGYADLAAALGRRGAERDPARWLVAQETLLAAARIGDAAAVDGPSFALRDTRAVGAEARAARELGYDGKWAIHPAQVEPINAAFAASAGERRWATRVREALGRRRRGRRRRGRARRDHGRRGHAAARRASARAARAPEPPARSSPRTGWPRPTTRTFRTARRSPLPASRSPRATRRCTSRSWAIACGSRSTPACTRP